MDEDHLTEDELTLDQKIEVLMADLPIPMQRFMRSRERDAISLELSNKYNLHVDQAGVFEASYLYMLLGVYTPEEFVQQLRKTGIAEDTIRSLTADINERVFKPIQNAERAAGAVVPPVYTAPNMPTPFSVSVVAPVPALAPTVAPAPVLVAPSVFPEPHYEEPAIRTMAHDMQVMKEETKHPHATPVSWQPSSPARTFQTSSVPNTGAASTSVPPQQPSVPIYAPAPMNLPGQPTNTVRIPSMPVPTNGVMPIIKEYGVDPYRETPI